MKLELESLYVRDVVFGDKTTFKEGLLTIDRKAMTELVLSEVEIASVELNIARPGDKTRLANVMDVIEPRAKVNQEGTDWAGVLGGLENHLGKGTTRALKGMSIMIHDRTWDHSSIMIAHLDMSGPCALYSPYSKLINLSMDCKPVEGVDLYDFSRALRRAGYRLGVHLARASLDQAADQIEILDNEGCRPGLPRIGYYFQMFNPQFGIPESILYGFELPDTLPLVIQPQEVVDGAVAWGRSYQLMETYSIQNHPIIFDLCRRHGKDLNFAGMMVGNTSLDERRRQLSSMMAANTFKDTFKCDGVVLTKAMSGAAHYCEAAVASELERRGVKTVLMANIMNSQSRVESELMFSDPQLDAVVQLGATIERIDCPAVDRVYGADPTDTLMFYSRTYPQAQGAIRLDMFNVLGAMNHVGHGSMMGVNY